MYIHLAVHFFILTKCDNHLHWDIIQWITALKLMQLSVSPIGISKMQHWVYDGNTIHHEANKYPM